jgi:predicted amidohydrolase
MTPFAIAGIQMHVQAADNLPEIERQLAVLTFRFPWVKMAVFSELAVAGPDPALAVATGSETELKLCELAKRYGLWLIPGSHFEKVEDRIYNTSLVINPEGIIVNRYHKMFPFMPYETGITPGSEFCIFDVPNVGRFGLSICYDAWFPETSRTLTALGAEVIIHPTLTGTIDRDIELANAVATAALNQCYFVDINGLLAGGNGRSIIVDPAGKVMHQAGEIDQIIALELDLDQVRRQRTKGIMGGLGQPLKSFRDRAVDFSVYQDGFNNDYLNSLGPLQKATRD